jgi:hypothetical protein
VILISNEDKSVLSPGYDYRNNQDGFITKMNTEGEILELKWITGLEDPKGIAVYKNVLYVADGENIRSFDIQSRKSLKRFKPTGKPPGLERRVAAPGTIQEPPRAFNFESVHVTPEGKIFCLDSGYGVVYELVNDFLEVYKVDEKFTSCHKLFSQRGDLYVLGYFNLYALSSPKGAVADQSHRVADLFAASISEVDPYEYILLTGTGGLYRWFETPSVIAHPHPAFLYNSDLVYLPKTRTVIIINSQLNQAIAMKLKYNR